MHGVRSLITKLAADTDCSNDRLGGWEGGWGWVGIMGDWAKYTARASDHSIYPGDIEQSLNKANNALPEQDHQLLIYMHWYEGEGTSVCMSDDEQE